MRNDTIISAIKKYGIEIRHVPSASGSLRYLFVHPDGEHFHLCSSLNLFYRCYIKNHRDNAWDVLNPATWPDIDHESWIWTRLQFDVL